jgi:hypothetical protein
MRPEERDAQTVRAWLDEAWRHGEVVAEPEAWLNGAAPGRPARAPRGAHLVRRVVRALRAVLHATSRA